MHRSTRRGIRLFQTERPYFFNLDAVDIVLLKPENIAVFSQADNNSKHMRMVQKTMKARIIVGMVRGLPGLSKGTQDRKQLLELYYQVVDGSEAGLSPNLKIELALAVKPEDPGRALKLLFEELRFVKAKMPDDYLIFTTSSLIAESLLEINRPHQAMDMLEHLTLPSD